VRATSAWASPPRSRSIALHALVAIQHGRSSELDSSIHGTSSTFARPGADELALEFGETAQDREHQATVRCGRVRPGVVQGPETGAALADRVQDV
jgi:hypothetical protein